MPVPPNWLGLALFGILGFINAGFWIIGLGLEAGYLLTLISSKRFQRFVAASDTIRQRRLQGKKAQAMLLRLPGDDQRAFTLLQNRCRRITQEALSTDAADVLRPQLEALGGLLYMYLRLLVTRQSFRRLLEDVQNAPSIDVRLKELDDKLRASSLSDDLRTSLQGQADILRQRRVRHEEARDKLAFIDAELARVEQQVELVREALTVSSDPETLSHQVNQIGASLNTTTEWIRQQQELLGQIDDTWNQPAPSLLEPPTAA